MGVYIKNITKDDLAENGALMWGKRIIFIPPEDIIPVQDHGDLIDREYAVGSACSGRIRALPTTEDGEDWIRVEEVRQSLKSVPVVIPAERSEE